MKERKTAQNEGTIKKVNYVHHIEGNGLSNVGELFAYAHAVRVV